MALGGGGRDVRKETISPRRPGEQLARSGTPREPTGEDSGDELAGLVNLTSRSTLFTDRRCILFPFAPHVSTLHTELPTHPRWPRGIPGSSSPSCTMLPKARQLTRSALTIQTATWDLRSSSDRPHA